jgi:hypothetical protein
LRRRPRIWIWKGIDGIIKDDGFLSAGVAPGGLYNREQVRLLLCVLARRLAQPLTTALAEQVFAQEGLANYFEFHAALQELLQAGQLRLNPSGELSVPAAFVNAVEELSRELPRKACDRAVHATERLQEESRRERENHITVYPTADGGCYMTFHQGEHTDMLMSVTLYLPDREQAARVRANFLADPGRLYGAVLGALEG